MKAAEALAERGIDTEVIDLRTIKPLDEDTILESVIKTGRLVVVDAAWRTCGVAADISALVNEKAFGHLKAPVRRTTLPDVPAPMNRLMEEQYYITAQDVMTDVEAVLDFPPTSAADDLQ